jgi:hypothetical protein
MINPASQPECSSPAEWRLQTGRPAKALLPHYRLDCDYGTSIIMSWKEGSGEPIYVCDSHAKQLGRSREYFPEARIVTAPSEPDAHTNAHIVTSSPEPPVTPVKSEESAKAQEVPGEKTEKKSDTPVSFQPAPTVAVEKPAVEKPQRPIVERPIIEVREKPSARDVTYGNSAKAMVDEAIWNMAPGNLQAYKTALRQGKSPGEAAEAAGGQLAFIHRKISDYTLKLEGILSASHRTIKVEETIDKPLEQATLEIIGNGAMNDSEKDAAIEELGTLQEWVKHGLQQEMTPLQANQIALAIGDRANWGGNSRVSQNSKAAYRALYISLRTALCAVAPEAQNLHDRLTNLYAAKSEMQVH